MMREYGFEDAAQIQGRPHIPAVEQGFARKTRPICDDATALYRTAGEKGLCQAVFENIQGNGSAAPGLTSPFPYAGGGCAGVLGSSESIQAQLGA